MLIKFGFWRYNKLIFCVFVLMVGFLCGHIIHRLIAKSETILFLNRQPKQKQYMQLEGNNDIQVINNEGASLNKVTKETRQKISKHPVHKTSKPKMDSEKHDSQKQHKTLSTKKDLKKEIQDDVPRNILINCGGTFPDTIHLFLQTYPQAHQFHQLYSIISDKSYELFYENFDHHKLFAPFIITTDNSTSKQATINRFGSMRQLYGNVPMLDIVKWLQSHVHEEDHVIFKLDDDKDVEVIKKLANTGAVELIDKLYTTTLNNETLTLYQTILEKHETLLYTWDNTKWTYSDFNQMNMPKIPLGKTEYITKCFSPTLAEPFALILYSKHVTTETEKILKMLHTYGKDRKVSANIFLPIEYYRTYHKYALYDIYPMGLYIHENFTDSSSNSSEIILNRYRNLVVEASHQFERLHITPPQYVMATKSFDNDIGKQLIKNRHIIIVKDHTDINSKTKALLDTGELSIDTIDRKPGEYLAIDLEQENADILAMYVIKRFEPWLLSLPQCIENSPV